jgi:hypothetical protein
MKTNHLDEVDLGFVPHLLVVQATALQGVELLDCAVELKKNTSCVSK